MIIKKSIRGNLNHAGFVRPEIIDKINKPVQEVGTLKFKLFHGIKNKMTYPVKVSCHPSRINTKI
jgi:hypothetical protein